MNCGDAALNADGDLSMVGCLAVTKNVVGSFGQKQVQLFYSNTQLQLRLGVSAEVWNTNTQLGVWLKTPIPQVEGIKSVAGQIFHQIIAAPCSFQILKSVLERRDIVVPTLTPPITKFQSLRNANAPETLHYLTSPLHTKGAKLRHDC